jgi:hypothetical protein
MKQIPGVPVPFFGLQDVVVIECTSSDGVDELVTTARKQCRSTHFVMIDVFQELPDDFMMRALATPRDGNSKVLGYRVYGRESDD